MITYVYGQGKEPRKDEKRFDQGNSRERDSGETRQQRFNWLAYSRTTLGGWRNLTSNDLPTMPHVPTVPTYLIIKNKILKEGAGQHQRDWQGG